jgi:hypothetical protein
MSFVAGSGRSWSAVGLSLAIWSTIVAVALALADGVFHGPLSFRYGMSDIHDAALVSMFSTWTYDLRQTVDGLIYIGALLFIGAKFFETRTTFAVTFDRVDVSKIIVKGPDGDNIVWIGQRYGNELEAQTVAAALENRLKENAA